MSVTPDSDEQQQQPTPPDDAYPPPGTLAHDFQTLHQTWDALQRTLPLPEWWFIGFLYAGMLFVVTVSVVIISHFTH